MITEIAFKFKLPGLNGASGILRLHWAKRNALAKKFDWLVKAATTYRHPGKVSFELIRYSTGRLCDYDNLVSTGKLPVDSLVKCGVIVDDNPQVIVERKYSQVRVKGKENQKTVIRIVDVP